MGKTWVGYLAVVGVWQFVALLIYLAILGPTVLAWALGALAGSKTATVMWRRQSGRKSPGVVVVAVAMLAVSFPISFLANVAASYLVGGALWVEPALAEEAPLTDLLGMLMMTTLTDLLGMLAAADVARRVLRRGPATAVGRGES